MYYVLHIYSKEFCYSLSEKHLLTLKNFFSSKQKFFRRKIFLTYTPKDFVTFA